MSDVTPHTEAALVPRAPVSLGLLMTCLLGSLAALALGVLVFNLVTHILFISWISALCDFVAGWLSPFFMLWVNVLTNHLSVVAAIFVVVALTSGCVLFKTSSVGAECTLVGCLILMVLSFALYGSTHRRDGEIRTKDLVAKVEHRLAFVPASQWSRPELWLDATTDRSRFDVSSTEQGLALTLTDHYQQCEARVAQAAQDTALYTLVSVNGAPVVAGKNPCVNFLNNALVVRLNPITASAP